MNSCCLISGLSVFLIGFQIVKRLFPWIYENIIGPQFFGPTVDLKSMGKWALITGATDGIGKSYAKALAKKGLNLVLVSRSKSKLETVANEIKDAYKVDVKIIDVDFTKNAEIFEKIKTNIEDLEIGVLVNNVGISYSHPQYFLEVENRDQFFRDIINCNVISVTHMCEMILPQMIDRKKGVIINIASLAAVIPNPLLSVYSASKAFVDKFTADLNTEYKQYGIIFQSVRPGFVATNMSKMKPTMMAPSPDTYVDSALKTLGIATHTTGYFGHSLLQLTLDIIAAVTSVSFANNYVLKEMLATRTRALRRKEKSS